MNKPFLLLTIFVVFGISLFGCSTESEDGSAVSDTSVSKQTHSTSQTNKMSQTVDTSETGEMTTKENSATTSESTEKTSSSENEQEENTQATVPLKKYTDEEKDELTQEFLDWAVPRAEEGNMAVTDDYFDHGASGFGDWFAETEDGEIQVQQQVPTKELPGYDAYDMHALGGVVFYTSSSGVTGYDKEPKEKHGGAGGGRDYGRVADPDYPLHKYLLGDNGIVYELIGSVGELRSYQTGFGLYGDDGKTKEIEPEFTFKVSDDAAAQKAWQQMLESYQ